MLGDNLKEVVSVPRMKSGSVGRSPDRTMTASMILVTSDRFGAFRDQAGREKKEKGPREVKLAKPDAKQSGRKEHGK